MWVGNPHLDDASTPPYVCYVALTRSVIVVAIRLPRVALLLSLSPPPLVSSCMKLRVE